MTCALALVLLLDASASITTPQWQTQIEAHAEAFEYPAIQSAIQSTGTVMVHVDAFADYPVNMIPWRTIKTRQDIMSFASEIRESKRPISGSTNVDTAIWSGISALEGKDCDRLVIDLVTDGEAVGITTQYARDAAIERGITINGLGVGQEAAEWLRENAQTPDGFTRQADDWQDVSGALRAKMIKEIATGPLYPQLTP
jgi:hypothetical protein